MLFFTFLLFTKKGFTFLLWHILTYKVLIIKGSVNKKSKF